jgi:hypothetical protein
MANILPYNELKNSVISYSERNDQEFIDKIPEFIMFAQLDIAKDAKILTLNQYVKSNFIAGQAVYRKPGGWKNTLSFYYGTGTGYNTIKFLKPKALEYSFSIWPDLTKTGAPLYYSDYGYNNILIVPTPDVSYPYAWAYLSVPDPIDETHQRNYLTDEAPDLLFYATMVQVQLYLKNDERLQVWEAKYTKSLGAFIEEDRDRINDRFTNREMG